ncbi:MAG: ABC transporter substrate-binding protein [Lachnospiraceae bacterium]|jgi:peptide/nickel transport system substrate-binding protein
MGKVGKKLLAAVLAGILSAGTAAAVPAEEQTSAEDSGDKIVNIASTSTLSTLNPLNMDFTFMAMYSQSLMFLPLAEFTADSWEGMLAEDITTDNNLDFTVTLRDVTWTDGEPVTADDVIWTMLKITSPEVANPNFYFGDFKGFDDNGQSPSGAEQIEGIEKVDDKTIVFHADTEMSLNSFINNVCTWIMILPSHVLKDIPDDELSTSSWFNAPTVTDGPYVLDDCDPAHYVSYSANPDYVFGAPNIDKLNIRVVEPSGILAGLQNGEIDFVLPGIATIPNADLASVEALENVTTVTGSPVTNQITFINTRKITDSRVRQAIVYAIDRQLLIDGTLSGNGEIAEGFVSPASPYYDDTVEGFSYDPDKAKELLDEAGWDSSTVLEYYVWSGDDAMVKGSQIIQQELAEVGITVNLHTVDLDSLMSIAGTDDEALFTVQYTITPQDYYVDAQSLVDLEGDSWTGGYFNEDLHEALVSTQSAKTDDELIESYRKMTDILIEDVPMFSLYFISSVGVVSNRLTGAVPDFYGSLNHVEQWDIAE